MRQHSLRMLVIHDRQTVLGLPAWTWDALHVIARGEATTVEAVCTAIDDGRGPSDLDEAIFAFVAAGARHRGRPC